MAEIRPKSRTASEESTGTSIHFRNSTNAEDTMKMLREQNEVMLITTKRAQTETEIYRDKILECCEKTRMAMKVYNEQVLEAIQNVHKELDDIVVQTSTKELKAVEDNLREKQKFLDELNKAKEELNQHILAKKQKSHFPQTLLQSIEAEHEARMSTYQQLNYPITTTDCIDVEFKPPPVKDIEKLLRDTTIKLKTEQNLLQDHHAVLQDDQTTIQDQNLPLHQREKVENEKKKGHRNMKNCLIM